MFIKPQHRAILLRELQVLEEYKILTAPEVHETIRRVSNSELIQATVIRELISSLEGKIEIYTDDHDTEELDNNEEYQLTEELFVLLVQMEEHFKP